MTERELPDVRRRDGAAERLLRRASPVTWVLLVLLGLVAALALLDGPVSPLELLQTALVAAIGVGILAQQRAAAIRVDRREAREASFGRLLQGLSRSVSPGSVVQAIVQELCITSGADHVVVSRLRRADRVLETTLVSARDAFPPSTTYLPASVLEPAQTIGPDGVPRVPSRPRRPTGHDPGLSARALVAADEVAKRVRRDYGLPDTLAAPLLDGQRVVGALVLSHRTGRTWPAASQRLLDRAAEEVSLALARAHAYEEIEQQANMDALTALPNRRYFNELAGVTRVGRRVGDSIGLLMIDIDRFKGLNDRFGHAAGDRVLRAVADAIAASIRGEDTPARYGGEEFAVLLKRATPEQAAEVAERVRSNVAALGEEELGIAGNVSVSVGVAVSAPATRTFGELVERADAALYTAKRLGRDRVVVS